MHAGAHAVQIVSAATPERAAAFDDLEETFVDSAQGMDPKSLRAVVRYACDAIDGGTPEERKASTMNMSLSIDQRVFVDVNLDADDGEIVMTAINAEANRKRRGTDPRSAAERRAVALVAICRRSLDAGEVGTSRRIRPHVNIVADVERITGDAEVVSEARAEATLTGMLSRSTLERILCDWGSQKCSTSDARPASFRRNSGGRWSRDRGCVTPGCDEPPSRCEAHHIVVRVLGGKTNVTNTELRCWRCHDDVHRHSEPPD